jgi:hypothetical protein
MTVDNLWTCQPKIKHVLHCLRARNFKIYVKRAQQADLAVGAPTQGSQAQRTALIETSEPRFGPISQTVQQAIPTPPHSWQCRVQRNAYA